MMIEPPRIVELGNPYFRPSVSLDLEQYSKLDWAYLQRLWSSWSSAQSLSVRHDTNHLTDHPVHFLAVADVEKVALDVPTLAVDPSLERVLADQKVEVVDLIFPMETMS